VTDRPDFTESSEVVGHRVIQLESGLTVEQSDDALRQVTAPQLLVRAGIGTRFELRFAADGFIHQSLETPSDRIGRSGHSDLEIGAKVKLLDAAAAAVDLAVIPFLTIPAATDGFGSASYDGGVKLTVARDLPGGFGLSGNLNTVYGTDDDRRRTWDREASLSLGHGLGGPVSGFWETYGTLGGARNSWTFDTGVTFAVGANSQFDIEAGRRLSGDAARWFVGVGFVIRHAIR
jgi:hypothetical protein